MTNPPTTPYIQNSKSKFSKKKYAFNGQTCHKNNGWERKEKRTASHREPCPVLIWNPQDLMPCSSMDFPPLDMWRTHILRHRWLLVRARLLQINGPAVLQLVPTRASTAEHLGWVKLLDGWHSCYADFSGGGEERLYHDGLHQDPPELCHLPCHGQL